MNYKKVMARGGRKPFVGVKKTRTTRGGSMISKKAVVRRRR